MGGQVQDLELHSDHRRHCSSEDRLPRIPSRDSLQSMTEVSETGPNNQRSTKLGCFTTNQWFEEYIVSDVNEKEWEDDNIDHSSVASFNFDFDIDAEAIIDGTAEMNSQNRRSSSCRCSTSNHSTMRSSNTSSSNSYFPESNSFSSNGWQDCSMPSLVSFSNHESFGSIVAGGGSSSQHSRTNTNVDLSSVLEDLEAMQIIRPAVQSQQIEGSSSRWDHSCGHQVPVRRSKSADNDDLFFPKELLDSSRRREDVQQKRPAVLKRANSVASILSPKCSNYIPDVMPLREKRWQTIATTKNLGAGQQSGSVFSLSPPPRNFTVINNSREKPLLDANCSSPSRRPVKPLRLRSLSPTPTPSSKTTSIPPAISGW